MRAGWHIPWLVLTLWLSAAPFAAAQSQPIPKDDTIDRMRRLAERSAVTELPPQPEADRQPEASAAPPTDANIEQRSLGSVSNNPANTADSGLGDTDDKGWILNTLTALGLVVALVLLLRWGVTRFGGRVMSKPSRSVEVLSRTSVAPRNHVLLLRVGGRILVVGDSSNGLRTLSEIDDPEEVASLLAGIEADRAPSMSNSFSKVLNRHAQDHDARGLLAEEGGDHAEAHTDRARDSVSRLLGRVRAMSGKGGV